MTWASARSCPSSAPPTAPSPPSLTLGNPILGTNPDGLYYGLAVKANGGGTYTLYASRGSATNSDGSQPGIGIYTISAAGAITHTGDITVKHGDFPAGLAVDSRGCCMSRTMSTSPCRAQRHR